MICLSASYSTARATLQSKSTKDGLAIGVYEMISPNCYILR